MSRLTRIFLCDLVHTHLGTGTYMFPLNIGYVAAYALKHFGEKIDIRLFKYPADLLAALGEGAPDVIGLSNYVWNTDLNTRISERVRAVSGETMVVFGGPDIDNTEADVRRFFESHRDVDCYIPYQGETPFVRLVQKYMDAGGETAAALETAAEGVYSRCRRTGRVIRGGVLERIKEPDTIPSPYLTGLLDEFFDYPLIPIVETNRGCPYQCTFCAQALSSHHKIDFFRMERVKAELDYIADRVRHTPLLHLADSNFGIVERDIEIAEHIVGLTERTGYPRKCNMNWAKNQPKIYEIAEILRNINVILSLQSLDTLVLDKVKRKNISISVFRDVIERVSDAGGIAGTEIILGLPGETKASHMASIRTLFDWRIPYIICYNGLILRGSELSVQKKDGRFACRTKFRLGDCSFGDYDGMLAFEANEGILSTDTMTEEELLSFRPIHWLIQFMWNYRFYHDLLRYVAQLGVNPLDLIVRVIEEGFKSRSAAVRGLFAEFMDEAKGEWFESEEELREYYSQGENFAKLEDGHRGKLNGKYIFRTLVESKTEFERHVLDTAAGYSEGLAAKRHVLEEIVRFLNALTVDFSRRPEEMHERRELRFGYDIMQWRRSGYETDLEEMCDGGGVVYRFELPGDRKAALDKLAAQYRHRNRNVTLRKMAEFMTVNDFFYDVQACEASVQ